MPIVNIKLIDYVQLYNYKNLSVIINKGPSKEIAFRVIFKVPYKLC